MFVYFLGLCGIFKQHLVPLLFNSRLSVFLLVLLSNLHLLLVLLLAVAIPNLSSISHHSSYEYLGMSAVLCDAMPEHTVACHSGHCFAIAA